MSRLGIYIGIWVGLMTATAMELVVRLFVGESILVVLFIAIVASVQAIVVSMFYQHLRYEKIQLSILPLAAIVAIVFLSIAAGFSLPMMG